MFSYGSGCSSEFFSGTVSRNSKETLKQMNINARVNERYKLNMDEYENLLDINMEWIFGIKDKKMDINPFSDIYNKQLKGKGQLYLKQVSNYHREYEWS